MAVTIEVSDDALNAELVRLEGRLKDISPALMEVGEDMIARMKGRFATSTDPNGAAWAPLAQSTVTGYLASKKGSYRQDGALSALGQARRANRRPLIGETGALSSQLFWDISGGTLEVGSTMPYAPIQNFGGTTKPHDIVPRYKKALAFGGGIFRRVHHPGSKIPARPFFPVRQDGSLYPIEQEAILNTISAWIQS